MESKTSSGQVLIECALGLFTLAVLFAAILDFHIPQKGSYEHKQKKYFQKSHHPHTKNQNLRKHQILDFSQYRNGK